MKFSLALFVLTSTFASQAIRPPQNFEPLQTDSVAKQDLQVPAADTPSDQDPDKTDVISDKSTEVATQDSSDKSTETPQDSSDKSTETPSTDEESSETGDSDTGEMALGKVVAKVTASALMPNMTAVQAKVKMSTYARMVFLGPPGVGKGTYSSYLKTIYDIPHISTGDMIRDEISKNTKLGQEFRSYSDNGLLVPDELVSKIARVRLSKPDAASGYILDGFPRTIPQAKALQEFPAPPNFVINFHLPDKFLIGKLSGRRVCSNKKCGRNYNVESIHEGEYNMPPILPKVNGKCDDCSSAVIQREDDSEDIVKKRLQIYVNETSPLIDFYSQLGILRSFEPKKGFSDMHKLISFIADYYQNLNK